MIAPAPSARDPQPPLMGKLDVVLCSRICLITREKKLSDKMKARITRLAIEGR